MKSQTLTPAGVQPAPAQLAAERDRMNAMLAVIRRDFAGSAVRPDLPMALAPVPARTAPLPRTAAALADTTGPSAPGAMTPVLESVHAAFVRWTAAHDAESGIAGYAYGVGTQPGLADLSWWTSTGADTASYAVSLADLPSLAEDDTFYISAYAINGAGLSGPALASPPLTFHWDDLGQPGNALTVAYGVSGHDAQGALIAGWDSTEVATFDHFLSRMLPILTEIYGPPSHSYTVTLVKDLFYTGTNVFFGSDNTVHMAQMYPQLLTHELLHAYHDNVILSSSSHWHFSPHLSGFEESLAQGVSYACMNRYVQLYPGDSVVDSTALFGSSMAWDYDFRNVPALTTEDFWSDGGATGIFWERYEMGAAAVRKMELEDAGIFHAFNADYYARLNADHALTVSRDLARDIFAQHLPTVEGVPTASWIDQQRIFDCRVQTGHKIWVRTQHYPWWMEYLIFHTVYTYETFANGSDWAVWNGADYTYYNSNGTTGTSALRDWNDSLRWSGGVLIEPVLNPPALLTFGHDTRNFTTDTDTDPWPANDAADDILGLTDFGTYLWQITIDTMTVTLPRVMGAELRNVRGVFGAVLTADGTLAADGVLYLDHEGFAAEPPLPVSHGAFHGERAWATVANPQTGGTDTVPGRVTARYVAGDGSGWQASRNVDYGSWYGNQLLLFRTDAMTAVTAPPEAADAAVRLAVRPRLTAGGARFAVTALPHAALTLQVFAVNGRCVATLRAAANASGRAELRWDTRAIAAGVYAYRLRDAHGAAALGRCVIVR